MPAPTQTGSAATSVSKAAREPRPRAGRHLKDELHALKRQRILEVAAALFFERGYNGAPVDAIADQLHVTKPFIYSCFKNKEAILAEICETGIDESTAALDDALAGAGSFRARFIDAIWRVGDIVISRQAYVVVYLREMKKLGESDARRILRRRLKFDQKIANFLNEGIAAGEFKGGPAAMEAIWIGGLVSWLSLWYSRDGKLAAQDVLIGLVEAGLQLAGAPPLTPAEKDGLGR